MKRKIKVISRIDVLHESHEFGSAVPGPEDFKAESDHLDISDDYEADYLDLDAYFELSYDETDPDTAYRSRRILMYDKDSGLVTIRRESGSGVTEIIIEKHVLHKNTYPVEGVGELKLETYGQEIEWDLAIRLLYLTNIGGVWSRIDMTVTFEGIS